MRTGAPRRVMSRRAQKTERDAQPPSVGRSIVRRRPQCVAVAASHRRKRRSGCGSVVLYVPGTWEFVCARRRVGDDPPETQAATPFVRFLCDQCAGWTDGRRDGRPDGWPSSRLTDRTGAHIHPAGRHVQLSSTYRDIPVTGGECTIYPRSNQVYTKKPITFV